MEKNTSFISNILKGIVIGIANIIPGVSGGTMMVAMGIYDKLIYCLTHLFSQFHKFWKFLLAIGIGLIIAIVALSKLFEFLLETWPIATNLGFCGLILGSLPFIAKNVKGKGFNWIDGLCFALFFIFIIFTALLGETGSSSVVLNLSLPGILMLFVVGVISAATMVIPGVSGSMVLMLMGYYEPILQVVSTAVDSLAPFNWGSLQWCILIMIPFVLGVVVGIFAIAKLIEWIFSKWKVPAYWAIIGLIVASPFAILINTDYASFSIWQLLVGAICFIAGWFAASKLSKL